MKKILVPFDGSASARRALTFLVDLARDSPNLEVHLLNVQMLPLPYGDRLEGLLEAATKHAHEIALEGAGILAAQGIRATPHERPGRPGERNRQGRRGTGLRQHSDGHPRHEQLLQPGHGFGRHPRGARGFRAGGVGQVRFVAVVGRLGGRGRCLRNQGGVSS